jgi:hypothetical protein
MCCRLPGGCRRAAERSPPTNRHRSLRCFAGLMREHVFGTKRSARDHAWSGPTMLREHSDPAAQARGTPARPSETALSVTSTGHCVSGTAMIGSRNARRNDRDSRTGCRNTDLRHVHRTDRSAEHRMEHRERAFHVAERLDDRPEQAALAGKRVPHVLEQVPDVPEHRGIVREQRVEGGTC